MIVYLSLLVALIGLIVYLATKPDNPKPAELGRIMFFCGPMAFLLRITDTMISVVK